MPDFEDSVDKRNDPIKDKKAIALEYQKDQDPAPRMSNLARSQSGRGRMRRSAGLRKRRIRQH